MMLHFGTGGIPLSTSTNETISGVERIKQLDLDLMELEFVYGVKMTKENASLLRTTAEKNMVNLTIHGPYYINLATTEKTKLDNSYRHILDSARIGSLAGAISVTFHPAFIQTSTHELVYEKVKKALIEITQKLKEENVKVRISPELTGKESQFGRLEDLVRLCKEVEGLGFCYDFAHNYARSVGNNNSKEELTKSLSLIKRELGDSFLANMHLHISNIEFSPKGERNHLPFLKTPKEYWDRGIMTKKEEKEQLELIINKFYLDNKKIWSDRFDWKMIIRQLKEFNVGGYLVCESPLLEWDALLLKSYYQEV